MKQVSGRILVTGATGFIGGFLCKHLLLEGHSLCGTILAHENPSSLVAGVHPEVIKPLGPETPWDEHLAGIETIIHLAGRVHIMHDQSINALDEFRKINVEGTLKLAHDAVKAGVNRFVFISSVKVNGEESATPYTPDSLPHPSDPYGISKWEAEQGLRQVSSETGLELVVIRPTLVYGPGVKANFLNMMKVVSRGIPLPLASITNKRSLVYVGNLVDAIKVCATHTGSAGQTYLVSDGEDVSTPELIRRTSAALGESVRLFPVSTALMRLAGKLCGRSCAVSRLTGSLTVDSSKIRRELDWIPPFTMEAGLRETAEWFHRYSRGE